MAVSRWGYICKSLLGQSAINDDKMKLDGQWDRSRILIGLEVNVDSLTIQLHTAKRSDAWGK